MSRFLDRMAIGTSGVIGLLLLLVIILATALTPWLTPYGPWDLAGVPLTPPFVEPAHLLGTDTLGRDVLSGVLYGARVSLLVGALCTIATVFLGIVLGATAGYFGGLVDDALMRITELFQVLPGFIFAIVLVAIFHPDLVSIVLAIVLVSWAPVARLVRGEFLSLRSREFVEAAVTVGQSHTAIIFREILPNAMAPVAAMATLMVASAILLESSLGFLGLGDPNLMSWGYMIGASRTMIRIAWWTSVFPGLALLATVLAINLIGDALARPTRRMPSVAGHG